MLWSKRYINDSEAFLLRCKQAWIELTGFIDKKHVRKVYD